jgi:hypothetical protein
LAPEPNDIFVVYNTKAFANQKEKRYYTARREHGFECAEMQQAH